MTEDVAAALDASRAAQGFPPYVTDPQALAAAARLLRQVLPAVTENQEARAA